MLCMSMGARFHSLTSSAFDQQSLDPMGDLSKSLAEFIKDQCSLNKPLQIVGCDTKHFLGRQPIGKQIQVSEHTGIVSYEPTELSLTVRSGSRVSDIQDELKRFNQHLAFEPPDFNSGASIGGTIACGLAGPARPYRGSLRDFLLGITCINGRGELLRFGGQVMKNVAGYDVSRLMAGAMGTLGLILDASFKVLPIPEVEQTQVYEVSEDVALLRMNEWAAKALPLSAACFLDNKLRVRFSGQQTGIAEAIRDLGGEQDVKGKEFWTALREQHLPYFTTADVLWRLVVPQATQPLGLGKSLIDWGGGQRWLVGDHDDASIRRSVESLGGSATRFRGGDRTANVYHPLTSGIASLHRSLKAAFDPAGILNPGRLYDGM